MRALRTVLLGAVFGLTLASAAIAQGLPIVHAIGIGKGLQTQGWGSLGPAAAGQVPIAQGTSADPAFHAITGDCSLSSTGVISCPGASTETFSTVAAATAATIGSGITVVVTKQYTAGTNYGGGAYYRTNACVTALCITSADGAHWELQPIGGKIFPTQAGALADGTTDDQTALDNAYAFAQTNTVQLFFEKSGTYLHSSTWALGSTGCKIPNVDFVGPDNAVVVKHTGAGVGVSLDAGGSSICFGGQFGQTGRPLLTGNAATTDQFWIRSYHHLTPIRFFGGDAGTSELHVQFSVESYLDVTASTNVRSYSVKPTYGLLLELRGAGEYSSGGQFAAVIEGLTNGIRNDGADHVKFVGTLEGNTGFGYLGTANAGRDSLAELDNEANGSDDFSFAGEDNTLLQMPIGVSATPPSLNIGTGSVGIMVTGGIFDTINVNAGAVRASFQGVGYQTSFTNNGTNDSWTNLYAYNVGTGVATYQTDRPFGGVTGLTAVVSVRKGDDSGACNLTFTIGILTGNAC